MSAPTQQNEIEQLRNYWKQKEKEAEKQFSALRPSKFRITPKASDIRLYYKLNGYRVLKNLLKEYEACGNTTTQAFIEWFYQVECTLAICTERDTYHPSYHTKQEIEETLEIQKVIYELCRETKDYLHNKGIHIHLVTENDLESHRKQYVPQFHAQQQQAHAAKHPTTHQVRRPQKTNAAKAFEEQRNENT